MGIYSALSLRSNGIRSWNDATSRRFTGSMNIGQTAKNQVDFKTYDPNVGFGEKLFTGFKAAALYFPTNTLTSLLSFDKSPVGRTVDMAALGYLGFHIANPEIKENMMDVKANQWLPIIENGFSFVAGGAAAIGYWGLGLLTRAKHSIEDQADDITRFRAINEALTSGNVQLKNSNRALSTTNIELNKNYSQAIDAGNELAEHLSNANEGNRKLAEENQRLARQIEELNRQNTNTNKEIVTKGTEIARLQDNLKTSNGKNSKIVEELTVANNRLEALQLEMSQLSAEKAGIELGLNIERDKSRKLQTTNLHLLDQVRASKPKLPSAQNSIGLTAGLARLDQVQRDALSINEIPEPPAEPAKRTIRRVRTKKTAEVPAEVKTKSAKPKGTIIKQN